MGDHTFWFTCFLATVILLLPVVAWRFYRADVSPTLTDRARLRQRTDRKAKPKPEFRPFSGRRSRSVSGQNICRVSYKGGKNLQCLKIWEVSLSCLSYPIHYPR